MRTGNVRLHSGFGWIVSWRPGYPGWTRRGARPPVCGFVLLLREGCRRLRRTARWGSRRVRGGAAGTATGPRAFMVRRADDDD